MENQNVEPFGRSRNGAGQDNDDESVVHLGPETLVPTDQQAEEDMPGAGALVPLASQALTPQLAASMPLVALGDQQVERNYQFGGGTFEKANLGQQTFHITKNVSKVTNIVQQETAASTSGTSQKQNEASDTVRLTSELTMFEKNPINAQSRIFRAKLGSEITGDQDIIVKILPDGKRERKEARLHFSVPDHQNIVHRISTNVFNYRGLSSIYIAMELCDPLNLHQFIRKQKKQNVPFDSDLYKSFAEQIVTGLNYLHKHDIIHRDLKPHNLLLAENRTVIKITDFGLSKVVTSDQTSATQSMVQPGTDGWKSPEVLMDAEKISTSADIFSLGLVLFHVLSYGKHPFGSIPHSWNHYIIHNEKLNLGGLLVPRLEVAKVMLMSMLDPDPKKRPTAGDILNHPFFKGEPPMKLTEKQQLQLANETFTKMSLERNVKIKQNTEGASALPGVQETAENMSRTLSRLIDANSLELKPKPQGEPPIKLTDQQLSQLASETFAKISSEGKIKIKQNTEGASALPGVQETAEKMSRTLSRLIDANALELRPKPQGEPPVKITDQQPSQLVSEACTKMSLEGKVGIKQIKKAICCFSKASKTLQAYDPSRKTWTKLQKLHKDMMDYQLSAVVLDDNIYVLLLNKAVYRLNYTDSTSSWSQVSSMNAYHGHCPPATTVNRAVYVIGYSGLFASDAVERFDPQDGKWIAMGKMHRRKWAHAVAATKDFIYCIGGLDGRTRLRSVERFDPLNDSWADVAPMQNP